MSVDSNSKIVSLDAFRSYRKRQLSTDAPAQAGEETQDMLSYLLELGSNEPPEDEEEEKMSPVSALARDVMQKCIELGLVEEGTEEVAEGFSYDWGDSYISIDLFVLVELLERMGR